MCLFFLLILQKKFMQLQPHVCEFVGIMQFGEKQEKHFDPKLIFLLVTTCLTAAQLFVSLYHKENM